MELAMAEPRCLAMSKHTAVLDQLKTANEKLERIQKGLSAYLGDGCDFHASSFLVMKNCSKYLRRLRIPCGYNLLKKIFDGLQKLRLVTAKLLRELDQKREK